MVNEKYAKSYCKEDISKIENYDKAIADTTHTWDLHHRTEIWWNCSKQDLIDNECYYDRKACELIFLTPAEHNKLHSTGIHPSEDIKRKISEAHKGKIFTEEHRKNMSEARKGKILTEEHRRKISESLKGEKNPFYGKHHTDESLRKMSEALKGRHHSKEARRKMSEAHKGCPPTKGSTGMHWYNNGIVNKYTYECPEGFVRGMLKNG